MKRMLINATQPEELRVAITEGNLLYDLDIENISEIRRKGNIYKGKVSRIEPSLGAAFVNYGAERHGFLPFKEISPQFYPEKHNRNSRLSVSDCLKKDQEILVQVEKDERGNKGAALTTNISLAGRYLVLMPNNPKAAGISRRLEGRERDKLKERIASLNVPESMGLIVRTAGEGKDLEDLKWDLEYLHRVWEGISEANTLKNSPILIFKESDIIIRALRDYLKEDIEEIWVDTEEAFEEASEFVQRVMPDQAKILNKYENTLPLFTRYQIESQIETAYQREVKLTSGGSIVIDDAEALVAIDINSSQATSGKDIEETAVKTNIEACEEIGRQLRLRDIGGLVVIDFIDMMKLENKRAVEDAMREALSEDRARVQIGRISRFGLLELSRQRLRSSLKERWTQDINTLSTAVLRLLEEESSKEKTSEVRAIVSPDMSALLLNERRVRLNDIEARSSVKLVVISDATRPDSRFEVIRIKDGKVIDPEKNRSSISVADHFEKKSKKKTSEEKPLLDIKRSRRPKKSLFKRILELFKSNKPKKKYQKSNKRPKNSKNQGKRSYQKNRNRFDGRNKSNSFKSKDNKKTNSKPRKSQNSPDDKHHRDARKPKSENTKISKSKEITETRLSSEKENIVKNEVSPKPRKLSRPKKQKEVEVKKEVIEEKKTIERAANDPRNK
ncbi:Rne/Rng family ribonuclease [Gammaproteobacteria bacterium]|nr:Rne/Rng family ribonuclease [Gammaproteobacteria bacterium]